MNHYTFRSDGYIFCWVEYTLYFEEKTERELDTFLLFSYSADLVEIR